MKNYTNKFCDCGNPATSRDGSGYWCDDCRAMVKRVSDAATRMILEQRAPDPDYSATFQGRYERTVSR